MNQVLKSYKFRIYPTEDQKTKLNQTFGCVRFVWNKLVENFNNFNTPTFNANLSEADIKSSGEFPWLSDVSAASLQQKQRDFNETKSQFFSKTRKKPIGRMKFKKRGVRDSYRLPNPRFKLDRENSLIRLEKIGFIPIVLDRQIQEDADFRSVTVSKTPSGNFYVSILVKTNVDLLPQTGRAVGIDLGLNDLMILSSNHKIENPRWFRKNQAKLANAQKHLSRKKKGSNRYRKQRNKVAKVHEKISNQRKHFIHSITTSLIKEFDVICMEDLNVTGMAKNKSLSKSIMDAGWGEFIRQLKYKSSWYGRSFVQIDRFYPSSQICSSCGHKDGKKELSVRAWSCSACGVSHDRDMNAAQNILNKGFHDLIGSTISDESFDYKRGEEVRLEDHLDDLIASSVKRLDTLISVSGLQEVRHNQITPMSRQQIRSICSVGLMIETVETKEKITKVCTNMDFCGIYELRVKMECDI